MTAAFKIYDGERVDVARMGLREAYELEILPRDQNRNLKPATLCDVRCTLSKWETWCCSRQRVLTIADITDDHLNLFVQWCVAKGAIKPITANRYGSIVEQILKRFGPRIPGGNPKGLGLLPSFVCFDRLPVAEEAKMKYRVTVEDFRKVYAACRVAVYPNSGGRKPAPLRWRALLLLGWTYGLRLADLFQLEQSSFVENEKCPVAESIKNPHGWLDVRVRKNQRRIVLPLTVGVADHLRQSRLLTVRNFFDFGSGRKSWFAQWDAIFRAAGQVVESARPGRSRALWHSHDLRFSCNQNWRGLGGKELGQLVLGHADGVNDVHYTAPGELILPYLDRYPLCDWTVETAARKSLVIGH